MRDIRTGIADIAVHLAHDANVFIAVEKRILVIFHAITAAVGRLVGLKAGVGQHDDKSLSVLIC